MLGYLKCEIMKPFTIQVTILLENSFWVGIFERNDAEGYAVARQIFGEEPTDPELYDFILSHYQVLKFTEPKNFKLVIKRKNPKRMKREVRKVMEKSKDQLKKTTRAQEVLRLELEINKKIKKTLDKKEIQEQLQKKFMLKQAKKKQKHRGH